MRSIGILVCSVALFAGSVRSEAQAATSRPAAVAVTTASPTAPRPKALLPDAFAGWVAAEPPKAVTDPAQADSAGVTALKEYDFTDGMLASYKRDGETLALRALRFSDASGAYGAYSYYRQNGWPKADIGAGATSNHNRVLFWQGDTVVDATFSQISSMSAAELRELSGELPVPRGNKAIAPPILANLPQTSLDPQTSHYALGPAGYSGAGGVLPPELVGFDRGAETVTANYSLRSGPATLTIINYPTPQMALAQDRRFAPTSKRAARRSRRGPSRLPTPTRPLWRCDAAGRWWRWSAATRFPTRATSCCRWSILRTS